MRENLQKNKIGQISFRVPENLDLPSIINDCKLKFQLEGLSEDHIYFICDSLIHVQMLQIDQIEEGQGNGEEFVPLHANILRRVSHNYKKHIDFMLFHGIIETDGFWIQGEKSKGYRFSDKYSDGVRWITVFNYKLKQALRRRNIAMARAASKSNWGYKYLTQWFDDGKLGIDTEEAYTWIQNRQNADLNLPKQKGRKRKKFKADIHRLIVDKINSQDYNYKFAGLGHRFYTPLTTLKKELRNFLSYDGLPLVSVDIKNSQPYFSILLFNEDFWLEKKDQPLKLKFKNLFKNKELIINIKSIIKILKNSVNQYSKGFEENNFIKEVLGGTLYETIEADFRDFFPGRFSDRVATKKEMLTILYSDPSEYLNPYYKPCLLFRERYSEVYELFYEIKKQNYTNLPNLLQRIESFLVIDVCCKRISEKYPHIPLFTIHDSIMTTAGNENIIKQMMEDLVGEYVGHKPKLLVEHPVTPVLEIYKEIPGYENFYEISTTGKVRGIERIVGVDNKTRVVKPILLKIRKNNRGYEEVRLSKNGTTKTTFVHTLLALTYLTNPLNKKFVNHKNGDKTDNRLENLEWVTHSENVQHAYDNDLIKLKCKPVVDQCTGKEFSSVKEASVFYEINYSTLKNYINGARANPTCLQFRVA